jgi:hypothetical protein
MTQALTISKSMQVREVPWGRVFEIATERGKLEYKVATREFDRFLTRLLRPFNLYWFLGRRRSDAESRIVDALGEVLGADEVILLHTWKGSLWRIGYLYQFSLYLTPSFRSALGRAESRATIECGIAGQGVLIRHALMAMVVQLVGVVGASLLFALFAGVVLYGVALLLLFFNSPVAVTLSATRNASIGMGLLLSLVVVAAVVGRALANLGSLAFRFCWERWGRHGKEV